MSVTLLSPDDRTALERCAATTRDVRALKRAQALLWLLDGETVSAVARRLRVPRQTIYNWCAMYQARATEPFAQRLTDRPRQRPGERGTGAQAHIAQVIDQPPGAFGYDVPIWTTPLLQDYLAGLGITISTRQIRRILRALQYRYKRPRYRLARRSPTWRQAKGGSNAG